MTYFDPNAAGRPTSIDGRRDSFPGATRPKKSDNQTSSTIGPWVPALLPETPVVPARAPNGPDTPADPQEENVEIVHV
jgi:hypothetical protein